MLTRQTITARRGEQLLVARYLSNRLRFFKSRYMDVRTSLGEDYRCRLQLAFSRDESSSILPQVAAQPPLQACVPLMRSTSTVKCLLVLVKRKYHFGEGGRLASNNYLSLSLSRLHDLNIDETFGSNETWTQGKTRNWLTRTWIWEIRS